MNPSDHSLALASAAAERLHSDAASLRQYLKPATEGRGSPEGLPIGELMASMMRHGSVGIPSSRVGVDTDLTGACWRRADVNAMTVPEDLAGAQARFAARPGMRDAALIDFDWLRASANTRAMASAPGSKGGYMIGNEILPVADPLWQDSIIGVTGVQTIEGLPGPAAIPRGTGSVATSWQTIDGATTTAVDETLGSVSITPKTVLATVQCSVQLLRQGPEIQDFLFRLLMRTVRELFDTALLQGSGTAGQPQGLANLPPASGIQQVSGTSLAWAGILNAQRLALASGVRDSAMTWVGAPTVRETLGARERISTAGRFIWDDGKIAGSNAIATPDAPASTLFVGDFSQAVLALFGPGIELRFDPASNWNSGLVAFQVIAMVDIVFPQPSAFVRISSIT